MVLVCLLTVFSFLLSLSLSLLSLLSLTFLLVLCGVGDDLGFFQKIGLLTCMKCLGLWFKGFREGGTVSSMHCHILLHVCGAGGQGGGIQLRSCQNMIKPKRKVCLPLSPRPVCSNSSPPVEQIANQSSQRVFCKQ